MRKPSLTADPEVPNPVLRLSHEVSHPASQNTRQASEANAASQGEAINQDRQAIKAYWDFLKQEPEQIYQKTLQVQAQSAQNERALAAARQQLLTTQNELLESQKAFSMHPAHYLGLGLLALAGGSWFLERRRRLRMEEHFLEIGARGGIDIQTSQSGVLVVPQVSEASVSALRDNLPNRDEPQQALSGEVDSQQELTAAYSVHKNDVKPIASGNPNAHQTLAASSSLQSPALKDTDWMQDEEARLAFEQEMAEHEKRLTEYKTPPINTQEMNRQTSTPVNDPPEKAPALAQEVDVQAIGASLPVGAEVSKNDFSVSDGHSNRERTNPTQLEPSTSMETPYELMEVLLELRMVSAGLCALGRHSEASLILGKHIEQTPKTCAWAYLEYMHICSTTGDRDKFENMRKQYQLQFKHVPPYWQEPNSDVLGLENYGRASAELADAWKKTYASSLLVSWAVGSDNARRFFQRPAYQDLFDLYELLEQLKTVA